MSFRARLLLAFAAAVVLPLALFASGVRRQLSARVEAQQQRRVEALARVAMEDLRRESGSVATRLATLVGALADDNQFRLGAVRGDLAERGYVLDYAEQAMRLSGLSMLQLQDDAGRILSSGHFRNEFDRLDPDLPRLLAASGDSIALVSARTPEGHFLSLARMDSLRVGGRRFTLVGGIAVDPTLLERFARDGELTVSLVTPESTLSSPGVPDAERVAAELPLAYIDTRLGGPVRVGVARLVIGHSTTELAVLHEEVRRWLVAALIAAISGALVLAAWLSAGLSRPLADLARATSAIALEGPEVELATTRHDEIGALARRFTAMSRRLRASASKLRDAERRATVGEMARQVNHDIKNGLIPIRNVLRHLTEVQERRPEELALVFGERRATLESGIGYLDTLARNYARLTPRLERRPLDVNAVVREIALSAEASGVRVRMHLADPLPPVLGDAVVLRRILDNVVRNALESLPPGGGQITLTTRCVSKDGVQVTVSDTGRGMSEPELARAFDDFYTTKSGGTGLGLSVVRRLTADLDASLQVTSEPGKGTTMTIVFQGASRMSVLVTR